MLKRLLPALAVLAAITLISCGKPAKNSAHSIRHIQNQLHDLLKDGEISKETRWGVVNQLASSMKNGNDYTSMILFLTDWVESHPDDPYNAYWLLMVANAYMESDAEPIAEYYFERIIKNYNDLEVQGNSIHFLCLQHLIQLNTSSVNRISYFNQLISRFPKEVKITELYMRLAMEYENVGEWDQAIKSYQLFLEQDDATTIQIAGIPNAYAKAKYIIDFNDSPKNWTFDSLNDLVSSVKSAITSYNYRELDRYRSKVNFFSMSWRQDETAENSLSNFVMADFMHGNRIRYDKELDSMSGPTEAYLRTWGWNSYVNIWYLYFRKVNFPANPDIHGRWEWAGIYYGEKL